MARGSAVQYLTLLSFTSIMLLGADRALGSGLVTLDSSSRASLHGRPMTMVLDRAGKIASNARKEAEQVTQKWLAAKAEVEVQEPAMGSGAIDAPVDAPVSFSSDGRDVPRTATPLSQVDLAKVLIRGHELAFGEKPTELRMSVAWAHIALENGRGKEIYCNNFGNIVGGAASWTGQYYVRPVRERVKRDPDVWKYMPVKFRAYPTAEEGAKAYWELIQSRYPEALNYFDSGYAFEAGRKLAAKNYATAQVEPYALAMGKLSAMYRNHIVPALAKQ